MGACVRVAWRLCLLLCAYQLVRATFFLMNMQNFANEEGIYRAFVHGMRFDLSAIVILNALFFVVTLGGGERFVAHTQRWLFTVLNTVFLGLNITDAEYFKFSGSRLTLESFAILQDIQQQSLQLLFNYWPLTLAVVACGWLLYRAHGSAELFEQRFKASRWTSWLTKFAMLVGLVVAGRGGLQAKPLAAGHAYLFSKPEHISLTLNSTFTIVKSYKSRSLERLSYAKTWDELKANLRHDSEAPLPQYDKSTNVVVIVLESFGREYMGYKNDWEGYTPFLDELSSRSVFIDHAFTNGRRSIDALPSILASLPSLMVTPFATSAYQTRAIVGLPAILKNEGYTTAFFHGGHDGTMFFDILAARLGFDKYFGANAFPDQSQDDGRWGIFDEPFLTWTATKLSTLPRPFFSTIFTLSSHQPYKIPDAYLDRFPEGTLPIHRSIRYGDYALRMFFTEAAKQSWYEDTLFIITADHTSKSEKDIFQKDVGLFRAPILFFHPKQNPTFPNQVSLAQHIDIMPTVMDLLGVIPPPYARFGRSLLRDDAREPVILFNHPFYYVLQDSYLLRATVELSEMNLYNWREDPLLATPLAVDDPQAAPLFEALARTLQYYRNGLIENRLNW